jgi:hypothetical protein
MNRPLLENRRRWVVRSPVTRRSERTSAARAADDPFLLAFDDFHLVGRHL